MAPPIKGRAEHNLGHFLELADIGYIVSQIEGADDAIVAKNLDGIVTAWNQAAEQIFGYRSDEMLGQPIIRLIPEERAPEEDAILAKIRRGEPIRHFETVRRRKDGALIEVEETITPLRNRQGNIIGAAKITRDLTAVKRMEQRLTDNVERYRHMFETSREALAVISEPDWLFSEVNQSMLDMFGFEQREQFLELGPWNIAPDFQPSGRSSAAEAEFIIRTVMEAGSRFFEWRFKRRDGAEFDAEVLLTRLIDSHGRGFIQGSIRDITERKQAEIELINHRDHLQKLVADRTTALQQSESRFRRLFELSADALFLLDSQVIVDCNQSAIKLFGAQAREDLISLSFHELSPRLQADDADSLHLAQGYLQSAIETGSAHFEWRHRRLDGSEFAAEVLLSSLQLPGGPLLKANVRDITERNSLITDLAQAKLDAELANQGKSNFLTNISHDIRTPLTAILGLAQVLENGKVEGDAVELVHKIRIASRNLLALINDLLDFSKIEADHLEIEHRPFQLDDILDNIATVMTTDAGRYPVDLAIACSLESDALVGDALRLEQVLVNLVSNATKFTQSGHVLLDIRTLTKDEAGMDIQFLVRDTGIGIAQDQQQGLFKPFIQADASITRRYGGTGLGLAISRRLVTLMGGELQVRSESGQGSEFWFTLRLGLARPDRQPDSRPLASLDVLIADDSSISRDALSQCITMLGARAHTVDSGLAALEWVNSNRGKKSVILLNWQLPGMDGLEAAKVIAEICSDGPPPTVLIVNAGSLDKLPAHPDQHHVAGVLTKPVTPSRLRNVITQVLHRDRVESPTRADLVAEHIPRLTGLRVLTADDSEENQTVVWHMLTREGAKVIQVADGQQALDWLRQHPGSIDVVLMDLQMPVMDGYTATRALRNLAEWVNTPVIALTAGVFPSHREAAINAGMTDFLGKPFELNRLVTMLQQVTNRVNTAADWPMDSPDGFPTDALSLPGMNMGVARQIWSEPSAYQQSLRQFAETYQEAAEQFSDLEVSAGAALAHKLRGAAAMLALEEVAAKAGCLEQALRTGANTSHLLTPLADALDTALNSIKLFAPPLPTLGSGAQGKPELLPTESLKPYLANLLAALDSDDPNPIEPRLQELAQWLPKKQLAPISDAVRAFDFRGAEAAVYALAETLGISLLG